MYLDRREIPQKFATLILVVRTALSLTEPTHDNTPLENSEYGCMIGLSNGPHAQRNFSTPVSDLSRLSLTSHIRNLDINTSEGFSLYIALRLDNLGSVKEHEDRK
jgi:hypothetical protein